MSALEVCSRRGAIQIHVYLPFTLPVFSLLRSNVDRSHDRPFWTSTCKPWRRVVNDMKLQGPLIREIHSLPTGPSSAVRCLIQFVSNCKSFCIHQWYDNRNNWYSGAAQKNLIVRFGFVALDTVLNDCHAIELYATISLNFHRCKHFC